MIAENEGAKFLCKLIEGNFLCAESKESMNIWPFTEEPVLCKKHTGWMLFQVETGDPPS